MSVLLPPAIPIRRRPVSANYTQRSVSAPKPVINNSSPKNIRYQDNITKLRSVSVDNPVPEIDRSLRTVPSLSIDGASLESISDARSLGRCDQQKLISPNLAHVSGQETLQDVSPGGPRRSRFINFARKAPSHLTAQKRNTFLPDTNIDKENFGYLAPIISPNISSPRIARPKPSQLPRLTIPKNERPPVVLMDLAMMPNIGNPNSIASKQSSGMSLVGPRGRRNPYPTLNRSQETETRNSRDNSTIGATRKSINSIQTTSQDPSLLGNPQLSHNIQIPSALNFPDMSFTPLSQDSSPISPISTSKDEMIPTLQRIKIQRTSSKDNGDANTSLFSAIYKILRSPASARSISTTSASPQSSSPPSPTNKVSPLFSARAARRFNPAPALLSQSRKKACNVCGEEVNVAKFSIRPTARCKHESSTCHDCIVQWIKSSMNNDLFNIRCPEPSCQEEMSYQDIEFLAPPELFERYDTLLTLTKLSHLENFYWCAKSKCNSGQIHNPSRGGNLMRCHKCKYPQCVVHKCEWHYGETCHEYNLRTNSGYRRHQEDRWSDDTITKTTKECPACKVRIEKNHGCDHMTCMKCRWQFCWECSAHYSPIRNWGNSYHARSCKHHTKNLPVP